MLEDENLFQKILKGCSAIMFSFKVKAKKPNFVAENSDIVRVSAVNKI